MDKPLTSNTLDLIGVGCGPSNLALAIALEERGDGRKPLNTLFLDKQKDYNWHGNTITSQSGLQISFLKDLVSLRNPTSPYSFVNYLQKHGRLVDFINLGTFYPSRLEFNDYLRWISRQFSGQCQYGETVHTVEPIITKGSGLIDSLNVYSKDDSGNEHVRKTRSLVLSTGGSPKVPDVFKGIGKDKRIFHHSTYLSSMSELCAGDERCPLRIAVVGGGQSAAEAFIDLNDNYPEVKVDMILRGRDLRPADSTPFVNEIFAPSLTDLMYDSPQVVRDQLLQDYQHTNYSVVDAPMIDQIYNILYLQKVSGIERHVFRHTSIVEQVSVVDEEIQMNVRNTRTGEVHLGHYDAVILATGYERRQHQDLLSPLANYLGDYEVDRFYRVQADERCRAPIYLQGCNESSHGLSDTLLSVLAVRSDEIAASIYAAIESIKNQMVGTNSEDTKVALL